jgi:NAD(P)-dependent dehydrogenase (short-subunit alcohol dehydrogenase family)
VREIEGPNLEGPNLEGSHLEGPNLEGQAAIVTGGASGIGAAAVALFAERGMHVVVVDLEESAATATASEAGGVAVVGSVADPATWQSAVDAASARGDLALVYLNAGLYGWDGPIDELPLDLYERTIAANISGVVVGVRAVVPALRAAGGGGIVATASVAGIVPFAPNPLYTLTKQAVTGFVTSLAPSLVADAITLNAVCPGVVDTPMTVGALHGLDPTELGFTLIEPRQIAQVALELATGEGTGRSVAVLPGRDPIDWTFPVWSDLARS